MMNTIMTLSNLNAELKFKVKHDQLEFTKVSKRKLFYYLSESRNSKNFIKVIF